MVNNSSSVPPSGSGGPPPADNTTQKSAPGGQITFTHQGREFLGMQFEAKDWNKLMNIFLQGLSDYINKTFQKMTEKMKKDWKRGAGEDVD